MAEKQLGFLVHIERCIGCNACVISCKSYYQLDPAVNRRTVTALDEDLTGSVSRSYRSVACNHCQDPACASACPTGAYTKGDNGVVNHNFERCIGCKMCTYACPYSAPRFNSQTGRIDKCSFCEERLTQGEAPVCVASCPMEALEVVDMDKVNWSECSQTVSGFQDVSITTPSIGFVIPPAAERVRRDSK